MSQKTLIWFAAIGTALWFFLSKTKAAGAGSGKATAIPLFGGTTPSTTNGLRPVNNGPATRVTRPPSNPNNSALANLLAQLAAALQNQGKGGKGSGGGSGGGRGGSGPTRPAKQPDVPFTGQDQSANYTKDPATGIVYDNKTGAAVSGIPTDSGIPYDPGANATSQGWNPDTQPDQGLGDTSNAYDALYNESGGSTSGTGSSSSGSGSSDYTISGPDFSTDGGDPSARDSSGAGSIDSSGGSSGSGGFDAGSFDSGGFGGFDSGGGGFDAGSLSQSGPDEIT